MSTRLCTRLLPILIFAAQTVPCKQVNLTFQNSDDLAPLRLESGPSSLNLEIEEDALFVRLDGRDRLKLGTDSLDVLNASKPRRNSQARSW